jgi:Xaa-Pro dipeptidase
MRLKRAMERLHPALDYGIVLKRENIYYLTGFFPTTMAVLVLTDEPYLAISEMDSSIAEDVDLEVRVIKSFKKELKLFKGRVGVEKRSTTIGFTEKFLKGCEIEDLTFIEEMRQIKDPIELKLIKEAIKIAEDVLRDIKFEGMREREVSARIGFEVSRMGKIAFEPIVAAGKNSAVPHHTSAEKVIKRTDNVITDLGARFEHYNSDMTRTFSKDPTKKFKEVYEGVIEAQREGIRHLTPGSRAGDCDEVVRSVLREYGFEEYFVHSTGHGIGLEVHEAPGISRESDVVFREGMVVTVEPGVYIPEWGGVRIEDIVIVGKKPKILTRFPKLEF